MANRYYSPDDADSYVTPSRLKRLAKKKQVAYIVKWFHEFYWTLLRKRPTIVVKEVSSMSGVAPMTRLSKCLTNLAD